MGVVVVESGRGRAGLSLREAAVVRLLERLPDLGEPFGDGRSAGVGVHVPLMPHERGCGVLGSSRVCTCARQSVVELERLLRLMREDRHGALLTLEGSGERVSVRGCWWHVNAWWVSVRWVMFEPALRTGRRKAPVRLAVDDWGRVLPQRRAVREAGAREDVAYRGVRWLAVEWGIDQGPMVPVVREAV